MAAHLAQSMQGGKYDIPTLLSNPLGRPFAFNLAQMNAEQNTPMARAKLAAQEQETQQRGDLHPYAKTRAEAEAQVAQEQAAAAKDPMRAADRRAAIAERYLPTEARGAYAATGQYTPEPRVTVVPDGGTAIVRNRETGAYEAVQGGASDPQARFEKEFAKEQAPKMFVKASESYAAARDASNLAADMEAIAPHIISGTWAGASTAVKQFLNTHAPGVNFKEVGPTQLFISLGQKFVGAEGQKYRPLSNADITFIERGLPNIQKDPSSLPLILKAMQSASDREAMFRDLEMRALKSGKPPDYERIINQVNKTLPSFAQQYAAQLGAGKPGAAAQGGRQGAAPAEPKPLGEGTYQWDPNGGFQRVEGAQSAPAQSPPIDTSTPAGRARARRAQQQQERQTQSAQEQQAAQARQAEARALIDQEFRTDLAGMDPLTFAQKYDLFRRMLTPDQLRVLEQRIQQAERSGQ
jgi:hypothetical protein